MSKVLIVAEHLDGKLNASTAKCVSAAQALNPEAIDIVVLAADPAGVASDAAQIAGVAKVLTVANAANANAIAQVQAPQIAAIAKNYSHVFGPSTTFGKDLMPAVAALLGVAQVSDVMAVEGSHTFKRPIYAGNAIITVEAPTDHAVVATVRTASWPEAARGGSAAVEAANVDATLPSHTRFVGLAAGKSDRPDLQSAKRVVSGGRGVGSQENFKIIYDFADKLGAAVGASRAAVDAGYVPNELQVPDRQDHRAGTVRGGRHQRRHPASDRHQGRRHHRRHQQGRRCADLRDRGYRIGGGFVPGVAGTRTRTSGMNS